MLSAILFHRLEVNCRRVAMDRISIKRGERKQRREESYAWKESIDKHKIEGLE